jgi:hypothetical protein
MHICPSCGKAEAMRVRRILGEDDGGKALIAWCEACDVPGDGIETSDPSVEDMVWLAATDNETVQ